MRITRQANKKVRTPWYLRPVDPETGVQFYAHRAITAWMLGRPLLSHEVVHHKNSYRRDNHPDNPQVLTSQRTHAVHRYQTDAKDANHDEAPSMP